MDKPPPKKKSRLSLSLKKKRFAKPLTKAEVSKVREGFVPENTSKNTTWGLRVFEAWRDQRKCEEKCPSDLLESPSAESLDYWLSLFVAECRRADGEQYPASTIQCILSAVLRYGQSKSTDFPNFLAYKTDNRFRGLKGACFSRSLREQGIGGEVKHAAIFTREEENKLWGTATIAVDSPLALVRAVFFYVGKNLCLRGGQEQRCLQPSQFCRKHNPDRYIYTERGSKNHQGTFGKDKQSNKIVPIFANPDAKERCPVYLIDLYFSKFPEPPEQLDYFYLRPLSSTPDDSTEPWFQRSPIGKNTLAKFVENMCLSAGLEKKTNHSLRATGATAMFAAGVPEKMIKGVTGHRSSKSLEIYERPTLQQQIALSKDMSSSRTEKFNDGIQCSSGASDCNPGVEKENLPAETDDDVSKYLGSMFSGQLVHCPITFSPQTMVLNFQQPPKP